jgi:hypothetical protein
MMVCRCCERDFSGVRHCERSEAIQKVSVIANIRFVPQLKSAKTLVKRHREMLINIAVTKASL